MNAQEILGRRVMLLRKVKRLSTQHVAQLVGVSQPQLSRLESGKQGIRAEVAPRIAEALQVPLVALYLPATKEEDGFGAKVPLTDAMIMAGRRLIEVAQFLEQLKPAAVAAALRPLVKIEQSQPDSLENILAGDANVAE